MSSSSVLDQARQGDATAIAYLMNEALQSRGIEVHCDRQGDCLHLWLISPAVPAPTPTVTYLRRGLDRLQVSDIHSLQVYVYSPDRSIQGWGAEVALDAEDSEVQAFPLAAPAEGDMAEGDMAEGDVIEAAIPDDPLPAEDTSPHAGESEVISLEAPPEEMATNAAPAMTVDPQVAAPPPAEPAEAVSAAPPVNASASPMAEHYAVLELEPGTPLSKLEGTYFKLKAHALREGDRDRVERLKQAFHTLKDYIEHPPAPAAVAASAPEPAAPATPEASVPVPAEADTRSPVERVQDLLRQRHVSAQVAIHANELQISWLAVRVANSEEVAHQLHTFLQSQDLASLGLEGISTLVISSLTRDRAVVWQKQFPLSH